VATAAPGERPAALIVDSAFAGYGRIVRDKMRAAAITSPFARPAGALYGDEYDAERWIEKAGPGPVIVIHGTRDAVVPYEHGKILYGRAKDPKGFWTVEGGGHIAGLWNPSVRKQFLDFLSAWIPPGAGGACSP